MTKHRLPLALILCAGVLLTASAVLASTTKTIRGTAGPNVLRGTVGPDAIYGLGGNDKIYGGAGNDHLYGGAGNDLVVGGPGVDVLSCGAGNDTAVGDAKDKAAKDCEHTRGIPKVAPPPPPKPACSNGTDDDGDGKIDYPNDPGCDSPADTDETDPAPPPPPPAQAGTYCGFSEQGPGVCVTTSPDATTVVKFESESIMDCSYSGGSFRVRFSITLSGRSVPINPTDRSFSYTFNGMLTDSSGQLQNIQASYFINGVFTTDGKADGTFAFSSVAFDYQSVHFTCTQNPVGWHTTRQT